MCRRAISRRSTRIAPDFVAVAERFVGVPYLWGGKTSLGIDCSGLVQVALTAGRHRVPARQRHAGARARRRAVAASLPICGAATSSSGRAMSRSCATRATLVHANAFHMAVAVEPIAEAVARIAAGGSRVSAVKRLPDRWSAR